MTCVEPDYRTDQWTPLVYSKALVEVLYSLSIHAVDPGLQYYASIGNIDHYKTLEHIYQQSDQEVYKNVIQFLDHPSLMHSKQHHNFINSHSSSISEKESEELSEEYLTEENVQSVSKEYHVHQSMNEILNHMKTHGYNTMNKEDKRTLFCSTNHSNTHLYVHTSSYPQGNTPLSLSFLAIDSRYFLTFFNSNAKNQSYFEEESLSMNDWMDHYKNEFEYLATQWNAGYDQFLIDYLEDQFSSSLVAKEFIQPPFYFAFPSRCITLKSFNQYLIMNHIEPLTCDEIILQFRYSLLKLMNICFSINYPLLLFQSSEDMWYFTHSRSYKHLLSPAIKSLYIEDYLQSLNRGETELEIVLDREKSNHTVLKFDLYQSNCLFMQVCLLCSRG